MSSNQEIRKWFEEGKEQKAAYMLIVTDTFDYTAFPVYVRSQESAKFAIESYTRKPMSKVNEVYNLNLPIEDQLAEKKAWNI